jgi:solute carrier family 6 amino acid transporter-like protein 5/7/9/14
MELGLGQKFQRGDVSVFRSINKRLAGIGVASVFSSYFITFYYTVIIAWSCVYVVIAFVNPLPWDPSQKSLKFPNTSNAAKGIANNKDAPGFPDKCLTSMITNSKDALAASRAREFFYINVVKYYNTETCTKFNDQTDSTQFSIYSFCACIVVWTTIFLAIFRGVHGSSIIVWVTVPVPLIFILVMMFRGFFLQGAFDGIKLYIQGDATKKIDLASMWADAAG